MVVRVARLAAWVAVLSTAHLVVGALLRDDSTYFREADDVLADPGRLRGKDLQVHGCIVDGSIERTTDHYTFLLRSRLPERAHEKGRVLHVTYEGLVPDPFLPGCEVVVRARLRGDARLEVEPDGLMAKMYQREPPLCPF